MEMRPTCLFKSECRRWKPPPDGEFKLHTDASFRFGVGTGLGDVMLNGSGSVLWCFADMYGESFSVDVVEA